MTYPEGLEVTITFERPDGRLVGSATVRVREGETNDQAIERAAALARQQRLDEVPQ
ncbi:hypothetical protein [Streptomyces sp. NBC_01304]|uniref:hypothetical protein n=1 Tax=Streptomyces sp. NBC_01304 TaxID=2903818 RepID=UPI002E0FFCB1|nr:hypothetical protein OG430_44500 [Streptomyces sp. NBC_01304]